LTLFSKDLDNNENGYIEYGELERKQLAPDPKSHLHHSEREDDQSTRRHQYLRSMLGTDSNRTSRADFAQTIRGWRVPSMNPEKKAEEDHKEYMKKLSLDRRLRAYWSVAGPEVMFIALVISMQIALGTWQLVKYLTDIRYRIAFGWGVVLAKTSAGIL
jgi:dual oxidase